ncbi:MAG TPA: hypothetical protein PKH69_04525 [Thiobacillaceae bacterium]|jgi:hypothetical protein|nr:hypothetical protein [Thiobacillaceae bacterium]HNU63674.1 hypothetical protein [Thiobacillaceae bacterium]
MPEIEGRVRQWLLKRTRTSSTGKVLTKGIMAKLRKEVLDDPVALRRALLLLREDRHIDFTSDDRGEPVGSYITVVQPVEDIPAHVRHWSAVIEAAGLDPNDAAALIPLGDSISDFPEIDMAHLLRGLLELRQDQGKLAGRPAYLTSAEYLLGSSKLLTNLFPKRALKAFGISVDQFPTHPLYVVVAGPRDPATVVLVENPAAFEMAVATEAIKHCAFVATFGFGLSKAQEDYGNQLVSMVDERFNTSITLTREGSACPLAKDLLRHPNITFWGDLDPAGVEIYLRLKKSIPGLGLSALYQPMIEALRDPGSCHPYRKAVGKDGQRERPVKCPETEICAKRLLDLCKARGVDQEMVQPEEIDALAQYQLPTTP